MRLFAPPMTTMHNDDRNRRTVRSFVRRAGRLTESQKRALIELAPAYLVDHSANPLSFAEIFGRDAPVVMEIGFGNGASLAEMAVEVLTCADGREKTALSRAHAARWREAREAGAPPLLFPEKMPDIRRWTRGAMDIVERAVDDTGATTENATTTGNVFTNDSDIDTSDTLGIIGFSGSGFSGSGVTGIGGGSFSRGSSGKNFWASRL